MQRWIAVYTKPQAEGRAYLGIEAAGMQVFCPFERSSQRYRGVTYVTISPVFSRYIFARLEPDRIGRLLEIDGVEAVLCVTNEGRPTYIADEVIEALRSARDMGAFDYTGTKWVHDGEAVNIVDSALAGLIAKIKNAPKHRRNKRIELIVDCPFRVTGSIDKLQKIKA